MESNDRKVKTTKHRPKKIEEMTKDQIRQAIVKKRECNLKAQNIVECLLEKGITEAYFLHCLPEINQNHLDDVMEERSLIHLCGYPICKKTLSEKDIPKQKYRISMKTNKVYDITVRKYFCSNSCYKAAMHVKNQMLTSPLWFREYEDIPQFDLLPLNTSGTMGQVIDLSFVEEIKVAPRDSFKSVNDFANASLQDMTAPIENDNKDIVHNIPAEQNTGLSNELNKIDLNPLSSENTVNKGETDELSNETLKQSEKSAEKTRKPNPLNIVGDIIEKPEIKIDPILLSNTKHKPKSVQPENKLSHKKPLAVTVLTIEVEKCLADWFSLDTIILLFGEEKVKELVADKGECIKEYLNNYAQSILYNSNTYDHYQSLCRKLNMLDLEDKRFDAKTLQKETRPLPDYSILQEESKRMQLKVKAYFSGETKVNEIEKEETTTNPDDANVTNLPLVDKNSQNALRRRIVCQHLNRILPDLLSSLGLSTLSISSEVRLLVNTFKLKANNIMFKPLQWTLIAIIVIKLLSFRDKKLDNLLQHPTAYQHMQLLLLSYKQDGGYLDRLVSWLTDIDRLLDTNDTQLTVG